MLNRTQDHLNVGAYSVTARVATPFINVLCVNANRTELAPIIYETWPNAIRANESLIQSWETYALNGTGDTNTNNDTVLDAIFDWNDKNDTLTYSNSDHARPNGHNAPARQTSILTLSKVFVKYPLPGNTV
jgi:hypothetical protein